MALPTVITQLINIIYNFADTWYVGRTANASMVAALGVCFPIYVIMAAFANLDHVSKTLAFYCHIIFSTVAQSKRNPEP